MTACRACGADTGGTARFCPQCGLPLAVAEASEPDRASLLAAGDGTELIDLSPAPATTAEQVSLHRGRSGRFWAAAAAGVAVIAGGLWALGGFGSGGSGGDDGGGDEASAGPATTESPEERSTSTTRRSTTSTRSSSSTTFVLEGSRPLLGRPVGWSVLVGGWNGEDLERIDLDTGVVITYDQNGLPLAVVGDTLVLRPLGPDGSPGPIKAVPVEDPASSSGVELGPTPDWYEAGALVAASGGEVWLAAAEDGVWAWRLVRLSDGAELDRVTIGGVGESTPLRGAGPLVAGTASGGVFALDGDGYRQVHPGTPVVVSEDYVLARSCQAPGDCEMEWLRRRSWEVVDRPVPEDLAWPDSVTPDGRFLVYTSATDDGPFGPQMRVFDVDRGQPIDLDMQSWPGVFASPDGRFLVYEGSTGLAVYDVERAESVKIPGMGGGGSYVVFVPNEPSDQNGEPAAAVARGAWSVVRAGAK